MDSPKRKRICLRAGCDRGVRDAHRCCSYLCDTVNNRWEQVERMCRALGPVPLSVDMWTAAVELSDALTLEQQLESKMYRLAMEQGFTAEEWSGHQGQTAGSDGRLSSEATSGAGADPRGPTTHSDLAGPTTADTTARA